MPAHRTNRLFVAAAVGCASLASLTFLCTGCGAQEQGDSAMQTTSTTSTTTQASAAPFAGTFKVTVDGETSTLTIEQSGAELRGRIDNIPLRGKTDGEAAQIELLNPDTGAVGATGQLTLRGNEIVAVLTMNRPQTGQPVQLPPLTFTPIAASSSAPASPAPAATANDEQHDQRVVGRWLYTWTAASNGFTAAVDTFFVLKSDGTYEYGDGKAAAGGPDSSFVSDRGNVTTGQWRTENKILFLKQDGGEWTRVAKYLIDNSNMMLIYNNGSKKVWSRQ